MLLKKINKSNVIRVFVILLFLTFTVTSSSVYAHQSQKMTETSSVLENSNLISTESDITSTTIIPLDSIPTKPLQTTDNVSNPISSESNLTSETPIIPLVQKLTMQPAAADTLYQDCFFDMFYENTVFIGDSISVGFANFCQYSSDSIASDTTYFLAKEGCAAYIVTSELALTKYADRMPAYQNQLQYIEDSLSQMTNLEKAVICYGINDLVGSSPGEYIIDMTTLIERIHSKSPNLSIYIISIPCIAENASAGYLCNDSIQKANQLLEQTCTEQGWGFINLTEYLMNENLAICTEYSSDNYVHQNSSAYQIWTKVLRNYAYEHTKERHHETN